MDVEKLSCYTCTLSIAVMLKNDENKISERYWDKTMNCIFIVSTLNIIFWKMGTTEEFLSKKVTGQYFQQCGEWLMGGLYHR